MEGDELEKKPDRMFYGWLHKDTQVRRQIHRLDYEHMRGVFVITVVIG